MERGYLDVTEPKLGPKTSLETSKKIHIQAPDSFQGIRVEDVSHSYGRTEVLRSVNFSADQGEVCAILGPNGAGKTTLMRVITGFFLPAKGRIWHGGVEITRDPLKAKRLIGYLPERFPLYSYLTVLEFLSWCFELRGFKGKKGEEIRKVLNVVGLEEKAKTRISKLSKGMRQRVALAQVLLGDSPFLILDEPTSGLDPNQIREMRTLISNLKGSRTILLSTHILAEAAQIADRIVILSGGRVIAAGKPKELAKTYLEGESVYRIGLKGKFDLIESKLKKISHIRSFELIDSTEGSYQMELRVGSQANEEALLKDLVEEELRPFEFFKKQLKLEDIFIKAITQDTMG